MSPLPHRYQSFQPAQSPLYLVMHDPVLHQFIAYLSEKKRQQEEDPPAHLRLELPRSFVASVRESFRQHILQGEFHLHVLAHVLASHLLQGEFELHSSAIGILPGGENRPFIIRERITREMLVSQTDLDLGKQMLGNFRYNTREGWRPLDLSANFVEYIPARKPATGVNRLTSRVKAEEEIWNKVADEIFGLDELVQRDKQLQRYSKYIKDVFGIKIVCEDDAVCRRVHEALQRLTSAECDWQPFEERLGAYAVRRWSRPGQRLLDFVETKDYLSCELERMKKTGWKALKSVVRWQDELFEIQVQPVGNYYQEIDHMSGPSHQSFKLTRDTLRAELSTRIPLYGFYRDLLRMLFLGADVSFECANASVLVVDEPAA